MSIVLASGSPRRRELLSMVGLGDFIIIPDISGEDIQDGLSPEQVVCNIALQKAKNVAFSCGADDVIIAADTLVYLDGQPLGKPESPEGAVKMLTALSGKSHIVFTGIALLKGDKSVTCSEATAVYFRDIPGDEIEAYVKSGEPMDKAGAYAAQGRGAIFVERIEGDFFNVMGLPLCRLFVMLRDFGVKL